MKCLDNMLTGLVKPLFPPLFTSKAVSFYDVTNAYFINKRRYAYILTRKRRLRIKPIIRETSLKVREFWISLATATYFLKIILLLTTYHGFISVKDVICLFGNVIGLFVASGGVTSIVIGSEITVVTLLAKSTAENINMLLYTNSSNILK